MLNGNRYDALTGRLLDTQTITETDKRTPVNKESNHKKTNGNMLDGFSQRTGSSHVTAHAVHQKTEKSKTLMRSVVKKPVETKVHTTSAPSAHDLPAYNAEKDSAATSPHRLNPLRELRAQHSNKSTLVTKFGSQNSHTHPQHAPIIPVAEVPAHAHNKQITTLASQKSSTNPFQSAIDSAKSHEEPRVKRSTVSQRVADKLHINKKVLHFASSFAAVAILGGFFVYNNIPNLSMRVAATRSGVHGRLPGYQPAGFALSGPIQYQPGLVAINYKSNSDQRLFKLVQRTSDWTNETLLDNFVATERRQYQTYQNNGKTIYIYEGSNATWVDEGVWYQIEGNSALNSDQLLRLAASL